MKEICFCEAASLFHRFSFFWETFILRKCFGWLLVHKIFIYLFLKAHSQVWDNFWQLKALYKWWKMLTSNAPFLLKIFKFLSWLFNHVTKRLDKKDKFNLNFYEVTAWLTNHCSTQIAQYLEKWRQSDNKIWSVNIM